MFPTAAMGSNIAVKVSPLAGLCAAADFDAYSRSELVARRVERVVWESVGGTAKENNTTANKRVIKVGAGRFGKIWEERCVL